MPAIHSILSQEYRSKKINAAFPLVKNRHMTVGRPSLAAMTGGHRGPPHL